MPSTSKSKKIYSPASSTYGYTLKASLNEDSTNTGGNYSTVTVTASLKSDSIAFSTNSNNTLKIYVSDDNNNSGGVLIASKTVKSLGKNSTVSVSGTANLGHKGNGTLNAWATATWTKSGSVSYVPRSDSIVTDAIAMTTIPRQTSITSFNVSKRSETSVSVSWSAADACDAVWYSTNNGGSWTQSSGTSFVISGLTPNTTYNFKIRVRRTDSQLTTDSGTVQQTTYKSPTQNFVEKTETTIKMSWSIDSTANYVWYSKDNGANWTAVGAVNATSGTYTITGLNPNTTYNIKTRVRRSLANTTYDTSALAVATYNYPYVSAIGTGALTIGNSQTLTLYNPLNRLCSVFMKQDDISGTELYSGNTSTTSITFTPDSDTLYESIPNSTTGNAVYYCIYSNQNVGTKAGTYVVDNSQGQQNPTFIAEDWSYEGNYTNLTNDDQILINNISDVKITINNAATPKNYATISSYQLIWGSSTTTITTESGTVSKGNGDTLQVIAIDSRGYITTTVYNLGSNLVLYTAPVNSSASTHRDDGVSVDTILNFNGNFFNDKFGENGVNNAIEEIKYYTSTDNENWSSAYNISPSELSISNNNYTLSNYNIHLNGSSGGFPIGTQYYVKFELTDKLKTILVQNIIVTNGILARDVYIDNNNEYHEGLNGLANSNYTKEIHGTLNVTGEIYINGVPLSQLLQNS